MIKRKHWLEWLDLLLLTVLIIIAFVLLYQINDTGGNAKVINYAGIVRGGTQREVKQELEGYQNDALINKLDKILDEFANGQGPNYLIKIND